MAPPTLGVDRQRPDPPPVGASAAVVVVAAVTLASSLYFVSGLSSAGVTWRGDPEEAYGLELADLPAVVPRWVSAPVLSVMVLAALFAPVLAIACVLASGLLARAQRRSARRSSTVPAVAVALSIALAVLVLTWGDELSLWILD